MKNSNVKWRSMKKMIVIPVLTIVSFTCCNSQKSKIENAFEKYVEESFADPADFIKITKIQENPDTIKISSLIYLVEKSAEVANKSNHAYKEALSSFKEIEIGLMNNAGYIAMTGKTESAEKLKEHLGASIDVLNKGISLTDTILQQAQTIINKYKDNDIPLYLQYEISVRQKQTDDDKKKEIKTYYARCPYGEETYKIFTNSKISNLNELNFEGDSKDPKAKELGNEFGKLINNILKCEEITKSLNKLSDSLDF